MANGSEHSDPFPSILSFQADVRTTSRGGCRGLGVLATHRLGDQSLLDRLGADFHTDDPAINHGADLLNVRFELARGDAGYLRADAAQVLGFAAVGDLVAEGGLLAGEIANAWHRWVTSYSFQNSSGAV